MMGDEEKKVIEPEVKKEDAPVEIDVQKGEHGEKSIKVRGFKWWQIWILIATLMLGAIILFCRFTMTTDSFSCQNKGFKSSNQAQQTEEKK